MARAAVDIYQVLSVRHIILDRLVPVQLLAELIEIYNLQPGPCSDFTLVRNNFTQQDP